MTGPDLTCEGPDRLVAASANLKRARVAAPRAAGGHGPVTVPVPHQLAVCVFQVEGVTGHHPPRRDGRLVAPAGVPGRTAQRDVPVVVDGGQGLQVPLVSFILDSSSRVRSKNRN